ENEIAQSEAFSHERFVRYWLHSEHLLVDHKKMSKSLGNFFTLRDLLAKGYTGVQIRYLLLQTHYRTQLNFSFAGLDSAAKSIERLSDFVLRLRQIHQMTNSGLVEPFLKNASALFTEALSDDLNISPALAALFDLVREINSLCDSGKVGKEEAQKVLHLLERFDQVLGVLPLQTSAEAISRELQELLAQREAARASKNWKAADAARDQILASGYVIEDTPNGARLKKK
ncbi:MAG TPA: DALR domain-containing protein, partial [Rhabdochlamydiaceae bacterium]|nr:DALR domain-containing protein [Rhabdochlamydiaceae bacterium]